LTSSCSDNLICLMSGAGASVPPVVGSASVHAASRVALAVTPAIELHVTFLGGEILASSHSTRLLSLLGMSAPGFVGSSLSGHCYNIAKQNKILWHISFYIWQRNEKYA
jgi:hypothetical protein